MSSFRRAERRKAKLRLAITGPAGSGKTYGALLVAKGLGGRIAMIDTEKWTMPLQNWKKALNYFYVQYFERLNNVA